MSIHDEILRLVTQNLRRDEQQKAAILARFPEIGFAMDAASLAETSGRELAARVLEGYGLKVPTGGDALVLLDMYLAGRRQAQQLRSGIKAAALDGAESDNIIDRYIRGETT